MPTSKDQNSSKYKELTLRQELIYDFICKYMEHHPYPPTVREIQNSLKIKSTSTVQYALNALEEHGFIFRNGRKMRTIEIREKNERVNNDQVTMTPIVGSIAAGEPIFADENISEYYPLPSGVYNSERNHFILEIRGNSMIDVGIFNGDYVIVEQCDSANNGEIIAALIDDCATVKRFYKENDVIRLQPENKEMEPIIIKDDIRILGKIVGLFRNNIN